MNYVLLGHASVREFRHLGKNPPIAAGNWRAKPYHSRDLSEEAAYEDH